MTTLFDPIALGDLKLANRVVMAPMTRSRAGDGDVPGPDMVDYYRQRASAGLIVTEGVQPSAEGKGYCRTPGLHSAAQVDGWRAVTDAVHGEGGRIVAQIMHCGRIGSRHNKGEARTLAPSPIRARGKIFTDAAGMAEHEEPEALTLDDIARVIDEYAEAARNAVLAGFDGVELHGASGYLPMQFLSTNSNARTDRYGGPVENRIRFMVEAIDAMAAAIGAGRVGFRICPGNPFNDMADADPAETYTALLKVLASRGLAYCHLVDLRKPELDALALVKAHWSGPLILNESITFDLAQQIIADGVAEAVSFGRPYIGNPDLVARFRNGAALSEFDLKTLYSPGRKGYTDYPAMDA